MTGQNQSGTLHPSHVGEGEGGRCVWSLRKVFTLNICKLVARLFETQRQSPIQGRRTTDCREFRSCRHPWEYQARIATCSKKWLGNWPAKVARRFPSRILYLLKVNAQCVTDIIALEKHMVTNWCWFWLEGSGAVAKVGSETTRFDCFVGYLQRGRGTCFSVQIEILFVWHSPIITKDKINSRTGSPSHPVMCVIRSGDGGGGNAIPSSAISILRSLQQLGSSHLWETLGRGVSWILFQL